MEKLVMENIFSLVRESKILGAHELSNLTTKQRHKLAERGVILPLISMIESQDYETVEASLFALLSLAFGSERSKCRIVKSGAIPALRNLLQCENKSLIELSVALMLILSSSNPNKLPIASSGVIQILTEFLYNHENNVANVSCQTKLDAIATLHNLSTRQEITPLLVSSGLVLSLLRLIHSSEKSSEIVRKSLALLEDVISSSDEALEETAREPGAIRELVETVEEGSSQSREHAVKILLAICRSCRETYRGLILREGVMPGLLQLTVDGSWDGKNMATELLFLLRECSSYGPRIEESKHELVEQIMQEIDAEEEVVLDTTALRLVEEMIAKLNT